jgi:2-dehydropantoate 2-reductase
MTEMKIVVMGTGGVGGYFGARLAAAGHDVGFVARGKHLAAIKRNGLKVLSEKGDATIHPAKASDTPGDLGVADIVLFCVKAYDTESAAELIKPVVGPNTGVIPFLNGISHMEILERVLGPGHVIGGVANISALIEEPGVIRHFASMQTLRVGEMDDATTARTVAFRAACIEAGIDAPVPSSIQRELWQKFVMICTLAGANCLTRLPLGNCRRDPATRVLMETLAHETVAVAKALSVPLPEDQVERTMAVLDVLPATMKASILAALERGEKLEASALNGSVSRLGKAHGINTPMNYTVYASLAPHENGTPLNPDPRHPTV